MDENTLSKKIIGAAIEAHGSLGGPGLLECVYEEALAWELEQMGLAVERQVQQPILYKGIELGNPFRMDLVVEGKVVIECKATTQWNPVYESQALTYLRLSGLKLALVINFGEQFVKNGIHRVVNGL